MKPILANIACIGGCLSVVYGLTWIHPAAPWLGGGVLAFVAGLGLIKLETRERRKEKQDVR